MAHGSKLTPTLSAFIERQRLFFVATAAADGRVNLSPKGLDALRVLGPERVVWLNLSGSGNETAAHVAATGRMTLMFCAFEGDPMILRVYGRARVLHRAALDWPDLAALFPKMAGARQIFDLAIDLVQTSCGTGVPVMRHERERGESELLPFFEAMSAEELRAYWDRKNRFSIDGAPTGV